MIVRLSEGRWMDLGTMTRFERKDVQLADGLMTTLAITPQIGAREVLTDGEALAVEEALAEESRPFLGMAWEPGLNSLATPDTPPATALAEAMDEVMAALRGMTSAREEDARLNVLQRLRRFLFGGAR